VVVRLIVQQCFILVDEWIMYLLIINSDAQKAHLKEFGIDKRHLYGTLEYLVNSPLSYLKLIAHIDCRYCRKGLDSKFRINFTREINYTTF